MATDNYWASPEQVTFAQLCYTYLLISPSYDLARKFRQGLLTDAEKAILPADIDVVLGVHDLLGDLKQVEFDDWWPNKGIAAFGCEGKEAIVFPIDAIWPSKPAMTEQLADRMGQYLNGRFSEQDPMPCLIVSVPLTLTKWAATEQIKAFLDKTASKFNDAPRIKPIYELHGTKRDLKGLIRYMKCAMCRCEEPSAKLWEIGVLAELSTTYSERLAKGKGTLEDQQALKMLASRAIHRAVMIAENAARGKFPTYEPNKHALKPDWIAMGDVFDGLEGWYYEEE